MAHKPYHLHKRVTTKPGKYIYYVQFYDDSGKRLNAISTGQTSRAAAEVWAFDHLKKGTIPVRNYLTFGNYAEDWWIWDKCKYIEGKLARGGYCSRSYANTMRTYLDQHILPYFKNIKLQTLTHDLINNWVLDLRNKPGRGGNPLSPTTINHCLTCLKIMLKEAVTRGLLSRNPACFVGGLKEIPKTKSILELEEVRELFDRKNIYSVWSNDLLHYALNLLAASSGVRMGEAQALQIRNVRTNYIEIEYSWDRKYGLIPPKWQSQRSIPIPSKTSDCLFELIDKSPYRSSDDLIFWGFDRNTPIRNELILRSLYRALNIIGISPEERSRRNITFHSWRHFYNSVMRGKIHDYKLQKLTGHRTNEMTEHYTHFRLEDFNDVREIQENIFK